MRKRALTAAGTALTAVLLAGTLSGSASGHLRDDPVVDAFTETARGTDWRHVDTIDLPFDVYHPQGMSKVGDKYFISSVEIIERTQPCPDGCGGYDRTPGVGVGHLFVVNASGELLADVELGEGHMYHPGGIDFDGRWLWVPVAEYRPDSNSIVYRVDPDTLRVDEMFRVDDHIGGVVRDRVDGHVHGVSWGSRRLYEWSRWGRQFERQANPGHFIDYQDCDYLRYRKMICGGVADLPGPNDSTYKLGGLALIDLRTGRLLHEIPVPLYPSHTGNSITGNPVFLEATDDALRLYGAPDNDDDGAIHVYEAAL